MARHKKALIAAFKMHFKEQGFTKKDATWHLRTPEVIQVFNIQTSQWSERYYFNAGIYLRALGSLETPSESYCHIKTRIPDHKFHLESFQRANELASFERVEFGAEQRITDLKNLIYPLAFDWFHRFRDLACVKRQLAEIGLPWFYVSKEVWSTVDLDDPYI